MGPLAGFRYKEVIRKLRNTGFVFDRNSKGSHEVLEPKHPKKLPTPTIPAISPKTP